MVHPNMINGEIREALVPFSRAMTTHFNRGVEHRVNAIERMRTSRIWYFVRMNPPIFLVSIVG